MFSAASFSTGAFSPAAWLFDDAPPAPPPVVDPAFQVAGGRRLRDTRWVDDEPVRDVQAHNRRVLALLVAAIHSGLLD
ncbi:hypothetical protein UFOVP707_58 [uncultured Caudovirales phage]|uniref:Uncharacterized protein n=1 Tax=uncultured Caudovirales phage TaxID=2100421 RepID=A0A6J5NJY3_9CAUD|nr:hypothetical protein UFOVP707_58 [uncultured Caudovirales phage]